MAKLNGVVTVSERIEYGGNVYALSTEGAVTGDIIRFSTESEDYSYITRGGYYAVDSVDSANDPQITDDDGDKFDTIGDSFDVFKRTASVTPAEPRLAIGEYARIIGKGDRGEFSTHRFAIGEIVRITDHCGETDRVCAEYLDGRDLWWVYNGYLERVTEAEALGLRPQYTEVKRKARVGERIKIVSKCGTIGRYGNGDVLTVTQAERWCGPSDGGVSADNVNCGIYHTEYVVLEESAKPSVEPAVTSGRLAEALRNQFAKGDKVRLISGGGAYPLNGFHNGDICEVIEGFDTDGEFRIQSESGRRGYAKPEQIAKVSAEEVAKPSVKVGDSVRLTIADGAIPTYGYGYVKNGDIGVVTRINAGSGMVTFDFPNQTHWNGKLTEVTPLSSAEVEAYRKQAEIDAKTAKWERIGRKVNEYRTGDIVIFNGRERGSHGLNAYKGVTTTIEHIDDWGSAYRLAKPAYVSDVTGTKTTADEMTLVTPVESRFDR